MGVTQNEIQEEDDVVLAEKIDVSRPQTSEKAASVKSKPPSAQGTREEKPPPEVVDEMATTMVNARVLESEELMRRQLEEREKMLHERFEVLVPPPKKK